MCGADDHWVNAAMADDTIVVDLLLRLNGAATKTPIRKPPQLPLWTVRQRRSSANKNNQRKQAPRASPATPLSWSGGATSVSGGCGGSGGGDEESSRPLNVSAPARSKVNGDGEKSVSKRSKKKKTLAELRDEERLLLKERKDLKRDIAALRLNVEEQRILNENLKRMKIEPQPVPDSRDPAVPEESIPHTLPTISNNNAMLQFEQEPDEQPDPVFVLPDLNLPLDDNPGPDSTCGVR